MDSTPVSLLVRIQARGDDDAWERFLKFTTPLLEIWAARLGLRQHDAQDLVQDVLTVVAEKIPDFSYDRDKSFRGWLRTIAVNKWRHWHRRPRGVALSEAVSEGLVAEDPAELFHQKEFNNFLVARAMEVMRTEFEPTTWKACWEHVAHSRRAAEVGAELGISAGAVYVATSRVLHRLREELLGLMEDD
jgi:RNA polymerase sigma-70 factor, ECF subfamily